MVAESRSESATSEAEVDVEAREQAEKEVAAIDSRYDPGARPTVTLPGTGGMVSGTAFADMVDSTDQPDDTDQPRSSAESKDDSGA